MNICVFGDSIAWGAWDSQHGGWATLLRNYFESESSSCGEINIYNLGINSATTTSTLPRIVSEAKARNGDMIIIALGINDSATLSISNEFQVEPIIFKSNLAKITSLALELTPNVAFIGLTPIDDSKTSPFDSEGSYTQVDASKYNSMIYEHCQKSDIPFISLDNALGITQLSDGLHPNSIGHQNIFEIVKNAIIKICSSNYL